MASIEANGSESQMGAKGKTGQGAVTASWVIADRVDKDLEIPTLDAIEAAEMLFGKDAAEQMAGRREARLAGPKKHQVG